MDEVKHSSSSTNVTWACNTIDENGGAVIIVRSEKVRIVEIKPANRFLMFRHVERIIGVDLRITVLVDGRIGGKQLWLLLLKCLMRFKLRARLNNKAASATTSWVTRAAASTAASWRMAATA